jgi:eukaryotic-like serine/threonine-protein kinase
MAFLRANSFLDVIKHIIIIGVVGMLLLLAFFFVFLPSTTNHGETISVPQVTGMALTDLDSFLRERSLRYYVSDSSYNPSVKAFTILTQDPQPGATVKEQRKIYISYNMKNPPQINMPKLIDVSVKNAEMILKSYDLILGNITYVPDLAQNAVLKQLVKGKEVKPGEMVSKGSVVDLVVGDGLGNVDFAVPNIIGMPVDEATLLLEGQRLRVGNIIYVQDSSQPSGSVVRQRPTAEPGAIIREGQMIDLWVNGNNVLSAED